MRLISKMHLKWRTLNRLLDRKHPLLLKFIIIAVSFVAVFSILISSQTPAKLPDIYELEASSDPVIDDKYAVIKYNQDAKKYDDSFDIIAINSYNEGLVADTYNLQRHLSKLLFWDISESDHKLSLSRVANVAQVMIVT